MNAELQRLLWLDFSSSRVTALLLALGAVVGLGWLIDGHQFAGTSATFTLAAFVLLTVAWAAHQVSRALLDELRARTWDQQRMSALSPWAMTWGKLIGGSALAWFAGLIALVVHVIASPAGNLAWKLALCVGGALLIQSLALFGSLLMLQRGVQERASLVLRLVGSLLVGGIAYAFLKHERGTVEWFGQILPVLPFTASVVALLAGWILFGCQRLMSEELQVRTQPWALPGFIVFVSVLLGGFAISTDTAVGARAGVVAAIGVAVALAAAYFAAFALRTEMLLPRRIVVAARRSDWSRVGCLLPPWFVALVCALLAALAVQLTWQADGHVLQFIFGMRTATLASVAAGVRDLFVICALGYGVREDRGEIVSLLYLALVYWLLPGIFALTGASVLSALLTPVPWLMPTRALPALVVQAALACGFAWWAYRRRVQPLTAAADGRS